MWRRRRNAVQPETVVLAIHKELRLPVLQVSAKGLAESQEGVRQPVYLPEGPEEEPEDQTLGPGPRPGPEEGADPAGPSAGPETAETVRPGEPERRPPEESRQVLPAVLDVQSEPQEAWPAEISTNQQEALVRSQTGRR